MTLTKSDPDWFALIEPHITIDAENATTEDVIEVAKKHAHQVVDRVDEFEIDIERKVEWSVGTRLKRKHGVCKDRNGFSEIRLSLLSLRYNGWQTMMRVVRHELVHAWQHEHDKLNRTRGKDYYHNTESFERWMDVLDIWKSGSQVTSYRYRVRCHNCGATWGYYRMCGSVKRIRNGNRSCGQCDGDESDLHVYKDGEQLTEDDLWPPDPTLTKSARIFLYNEGPRKRRFVRKETDNTLDDILEWVPRTVTLRSFPGIGGQTATELAEHVMIIDDMVDDEGRLHKRVRDAVPAQFLDETTSRVVEWYEDALAQRDGTDLQQLQRATQQEKPWWKKQETLE